MPKKKRVPGYIPDPRRDEKCDCDHSRWHHSTKKCWMAFCRCQGFFVKGKEK